jgi:hypothetical protein
MESPTIADLADDSCCRVLQEESFVVVFEYILSHAFPSKPEALPVGEAPHARINSACHTD